MKRLIIIVEGQTEEEFVDSIIAPYLYANTKVVNVTPIKIATSAKAKGGFVNYQHLKNDVLRRIRESDVVVSMFVDYFRIPTDIPSYSTCINKGSLDDRINCLEHAIQTDIGFGNFIPYIQKHEFEALLFSSNSGFQSFYYENIYNETQKVIDAFPNPEDINTHPESAPSKRILSIMSDGSKYNKVADGNLIAMEIGIENILEKCPRFKKWINLLISNIS